jgi:hypothetical protein
MQSFCIFTQKKKSYLPERNSSGSSARGYQSPQSKSSAAVVFWLRAQGRREQIVPARNITYWNTLNLLQFQALPETSNP